MSPGRLIRGRCPLSGLGLHRNVEDVKGVLTHPFALGQEILRSDKKNEVLEQKMLMAINCVHLSNFGSIFIIE